MSYEHCLTHKLQGMDVHMMYYPVSVAVMAMMLSYTVQTGGASEIPTSCRTPPCPVDGGWSEYEIRGIRMTECPVSCGGGHTKDTLERFCTNPSPANGGMPCTGSSTTVMYTECPKQPSCPVQTGPVSEIPKSCNLPPCPVNGGWSEYEIRGIRMTKCPVSCGGGHTEDTLERFCTNPSPANGGMPCTGNSTRVMFTECPKQPSCPVEGHWGPFRRLGSQKKCPVTCGPARIFKMFFRDCYNPNHYKPCPYKPCPGKHFRIVYQDCNKGPCGTPV